ncbi:MAG TPA: transglutaminase N-terminal domain-containing protein [Desulfobacterales bacterium]
MRLEICHRTEYRYDRPLTLLPHIVRLRPGPNCRSSIETYALAVRPDSRHLHWQQDPFGNLLARLFFPEKSRELILNVDLTLGITEINPFDFFVESEAARYPFVYPQRVCKPLALYLEPGEDGPNLRRHLEPFRGFSGDTLEFLVVLNQHVHREIKYIERFESGVRPCEETLRRGRGACRDSAWLLVQILRHLGIAARFVSGYLLEIAADTDDVGHPPARSSDRVGLHAWTEAYLPGAGWVGLDPTTGLLTAEKHIPLAAAPVPADAAPVEGTTEPGQVQVHYESRVRRLD